LAEALIHQSRFCVVRTHTVPVLRRPALQTSFIIGRKAAGSLRNAVGGEHSGLAD
jgi:hypothetical protein